MGNYSIVLADDHVLIRQGLRRLIEGNCDLNIIGEAGDGMELLDLLNTIVPDLVILDLSMPKIKGLEALREIKNLHPATKVLILSMHKEYLQKALSTGADGYLIKEDADRDIFSAIQNIRQGKIYLSPRLGTEDVPVPAPASSEPISTREKEVLELVAKGKTNKEIADQLFISVRTVESHRAHIMAKLRLNSTAEIVKYAIQKGYV